MCMCMSYTDIIDITHVYYNLVVRYLTYLSYNLRQFCQQTYGHTLSIIYHLLNKLFSKVNMQKQIKVNGF